MFTFTEHTTLYRRIGLMLLLCQLNAFIAGMPPFQAGIWVQSEPTVFVLFIAGALTGLWLAVGLWRRWLVPSPTSPLMLCLLLWALWQIIITCMATLPSRSWFGPPQTGDGTGMSIAMILTILLTCPLWQVPALRRIIMIAASASLFVQCALHVYYPEVPGNVYMPDRWVPAQWPEYLPFLGGYLWIAAFTSGTITTPKRYAKLVIAMILLLADSLNKSAMGLFAVALLLTSIAGYMPLSERLRRIFTPTMAWRKLMMAACVLPFSLTLLSPVFPTLDAGRDPTGILRLFARINDGIGARLAMDQVGLSALQHEPSRLFIGNGWGGFTDDLFKYALVDGVYVYKDGVKDQNWFLIEGSSHHSHNQPLEALLSLGIIGIILWYALPMVALWTLPEPWFWPCAPMIVALTGLGHFWFQLPQCFPWQALYMAVLIAVCAKNNGSVTTRKALWYGAACAVAAMAMAWSANRQYTMMMHADALHDATLNDSYKDYSEAWMGEDLQYGGERWTASTRFYSGEAAAKTAKNELNDNLLGWYTYFLHTAHTAAQTPAIGARASSMELRLQYRLFSGFNDPLFDSLRHETTQNFEDAVMRMTYKAPLRDDYTSYFLISLPDFTHNDTAREIRILNRLLAIAPGHRGALWMLGKIYLATPGKEEPGRAMIEKAMATHVERVFPVTDAQLQNMTEKLGH